jgi:FkbM family methyltransferase
MRHRIQSAFSSMQDIARVASRSARWPVFSLTSSRLVSDLVRQSIAPAFVVDVGANRGQFAVAMLELVPTSTVLSFEPLPTQAAQLAGLHRRYGERLEVRNIALGGTHGRQELHINSHHQSSSLRSLAPRHLNAFPDAHDVGTVLVDVDRLDSQLSPADIPDNSMLKIDAQGFERDVIDGAGDLLLRFDILLIEASFQPLYDGEWTFVEMVEQLDSRGFSFVRPVGFLKSPSTAEYLQVDALFTRARA